ncbi:MAG: EamA family transporter [Clostridiales bacterium]|nr:EamA family transporter [Clostridiales bacterium]
MIYLILAVLASSSVAIIMRLGEKHIKNNFAMFMANYFVCSLIAYLFMGGANPFAVREGFGFALGLGLFSGCLYLLSFTLMKYNISRNGVMLSSVFMKLGVLIPAVMAIAAFGEKPTVLQIIGFALALAAILIIYLEPGKAGGERRTALLLLLLLLVSGMTESMANIYDKNGAADMKDRFLFFNFLTAFFLATAVTLIGGKRVSWKDIAFGAVIGVPNYFATRCLLLSLGQIPAVVTYPIYNIGAIVLISLAGLLLFKEKLSGRKLIGFVIIIISLVLLNL